MCEKFIWSLESANFPKKTDQLGTYRLVDDISRDL